MHRPWLPHHPPLDRSAVELAEDRHSQMIGQVALDHGVSVRRFNSVGDQLDELVDLFILRSVQPDEVLARQGEYSC